MDKKDIKRWVRQAQIVDLIARGNFTVAHLQMHVNGMVIDGWGFAKRNPSDPYDYCLGTDKAIGRARAELCKRVSRLLGEQQ